MKSKDEAEPQKAKADEKPAEKEPTPRIQLMRRQTPNLREADRK